MYPQTHHALLLNLSCDKSKEKTTNGVVMERKEMQKMAHKFTRIGKGMKVKRGEEREMRKRPGGSNVGKYKNVEKSDFAGPSGNSPKGSFPIDTLKRGKAALAYARNAPNPQGIRDAVYKKYPSLKK